MDHYDLVEGQGEGDGRKYRRIGTVETGLKQL